MVTLITLIPNSDTFTEDSQRPIRDGIMSTLCTLVSSGTDVEVTLAVYECIIRVAELYYVALQPYMDALAHLTFGAARGISAAPRTEVCAVSFSGIFRHGLWFHNLEWESELYVYTSLDATTLLPGNRRSGRRILDDSCRRGGRAG